MTAGQKIRKWTNLLIELVKLRISQMVAVSTTTGYILAAGEVNWRIVPAIAGTFLLACGSAAMNQYQERDRDHMMPRTRNRPIPSGRIRPAGAFAISLVLMFLGAIILLAGANPTAMILGVLTALWYNGIYTPLKRVTALAVVPGSVIGALPPMIGWTAAGGEVFDPRALAIAFFFFLWQIPHFWLLLLNFGKDYEKAGYPSLTTLFSKAQLSRITFMWILATAAAGIGIPLYGIGNSVPVFVFLLIAAGMLIWKSSGLVRTSVTRFSLRPAFLSINLFLLSVMFILSLDRLVNF
jgi:protoheme IX farnesyltransferase